MGAKKEALKVVLDTNVLLSALLFGGPVSRLTSLWKSGVIQPVFSRATFEECRRALAYPKFKLSEEEITFFLRDELLPFFEVVDVPHQIERICSDPDDDIFLACALAARAGYLVTGDAHLLTLKRHRTIRIISPADFIAGIERKLVTLEEHPAS